MSDQEAEVPGPEIVAVPPPPPWEPITPVPASKPFPGWWASIGLLVAIQFLANLVGFIFLAPGIVSDVMAHGTLTRTLPLAAVGIVANSIAFGLVTWFAWRASKLTAAEAFPLRRVSGGAWFTAALLMGGTVVLAEFVSSGMMRLWPPPDFVRDLFLQLVGDDAPVVVSIIFLVIVAPITEEFFFRGVLQKGLTRRYGRKAGVIGSGLLFGLIHLIPWQVVPAALLGLVFAWWTDRTGSLWPALVAHAVNNGMSYYLSRSQSGRDVLEPGPIDPVALAIGAGLLLAGLALSPRLLRPTEPETVGERSFT
ncbi:MAG TPA: type II CAAX endopeptidase family protein [Candidatus Eisenbacteria bacterium]